MSEPMQFRITITVPREDREPEVIKSTTIMAVMEKMESILMKAQAEGIFIEVAHDRIKYIPANLFINTIPEIEIL